MKARSTTAFSVLVLVGVGALVGYLYGSRGIPFVGGYTEWAIGIYSGDQPLEITPADWPNPVLTARDVTDVRAEFVADPFLIRNNGVWYMFFEVLNLDTGHGDLAFARSEDLRDWDYGGLVLDEPFHLSYPQVFAVGGQHYMVPETGEANEVRLYRAVSFPGKWEVERVLITGQHADPTIFEYQGRWWMYTSSATANDVLRLYWSDSLDGDWREHPDSPIVYLDSSRARPGGRVISDGRRLLRFAQDDRDVYGRRVRAFEVTTLTPTDYAEAELDWSTLSGTGSGWNAEGMHHVDLHAVDGQWIAVVDGWRAAVRVSAGL